MSAVARQKRPETASEAPAYAHASRGPERALSAVRDPAVPLDADLLAVLQLGQRIRDAGERVRCELGLDRNWREPGDVR